ncbi:MAG: NAD(+)/NADH kinase [Lachnospiraceae bacterium]|nr:NAD(+)/NADH kinase [Lachnospiraceae bacterium]
MKSFLLMTNSIKDPELKITNLIADYMRQCGAFCEIALDNAPEELPSVDAVVVLGGDGTMLRAAKAFAGRQLPMVGVNLGTMGFLTEVDPGNIQDMVNRLISEDFKVERRMHLEGSIYREGQRVFLHNALNDVVVSRSGFSKLICLRIYVNGRRLDVYEADGVVVSTPTGSTGYNLSAGGPIVSPEADNLIVTPISPHSLTSKSIVFAGDAVIRIEVVNKRPDVKTDAYANYDGQSGMAMMPGDVIELKKAESCTSLIKLYEVGFYEVLRNKISN